MFDGVKHPHIFIHKQGMFCLSDTSVFTPKVSKNILKPGMDINCGTYLSQYTQLALGQGKIQEEDINRAVSNLFSVQLLLGLFNGDPAKGNYGNLGREDVCTLEHRNLALDAARQGIVLLKNENNLLPLNRMAVTSLAIIGPSANSSSQLGGDYTGFSEKDSLSLSFFFFCSLKV